jgi:hypothetical protein
MGQHLFNEKFESIDAISEGNMPSWSGNSKFLESDEFLEKHLKFHFHFVSWRSRVTFISRYKTVLGRERLENLRI